MIWFLIEFRTFLAKKFAFASRQLLRRNKNKIDWFSSMIKNLLVRRNFLFDSKKKRSNEKFPFPVDSNRRKSTLFPRTIDERTNGSIFSVERRFSRSSRRSTASRSFDLLAEFDERFDADRSSFFHHWKRRSSFEKQKTKHFEKFLCSSEFLDRRTKRSRTFGSDAHREISSQQNSDLEQIDFSSPADRTKSPIYQKQRIETDQNFGQSEKSFRRKSNRIFTKFSGFFRSSRSRWISKSKSCGQISSEQNWTFRWNKSIEFH